MTVQISKGIYLVTEHERLPFARLLSITESLLPKGIAALQYRNKQADSAQKRIEARQLQTLCKTWKVPFIINDDISLAIELQADGVHLGRDDGSCSEARKRLGPNMLMGISCNNDINRANQAVQDGADYIAFGAMFPTSSKTNTVQATPDLIRQAKQRYTIPIVAIGGITPENCGPVINAGADLLAVISSVYLASDPAQVIDNFNKLMAKKYESV